ncbi:MAG: tRNA (adenosine(37)-N6)-threonylcarbamoyltransferase complex dimerization subunit type 1 TsaB [Acidobacteriaceae bacterium]
MKLLLIDSCGTQGGVALADTEIAAPVVAAVALMGRTFSVRLIPAVRETLEAGQATLDQLDAFVIVHGPGSFTGVRVGVSAVKGLAEATGKPVIALSRLAVLASLAAKDAVHVALDAGRGEFYYGRYRKQGRVCEQEALLKKEGMLAACSAEVLPLVVCEDAVAAALAEAAPVLLPAPMPADALPLAVDAFAAKQFADVALLDANYLRSSDAEIFSKPKLETSLAGNVVS